MNILEAKQEVILKGLDPQAYDWESYSDDIPLEDWLKEEYQLSLIGMKEQVHAANAAQDTIKAESFNTGLSLFDLDKTRSVAITGNPDSGKTNLAFALMNNYKGKRKKYLFGYPVGVVGYYNIADWKDLFRIKHAIIFIDEIQKYIKLYDNRANHELMNVISMLAQLDNTLIFTTQFSQFITKGVEAGIQTWCIKQLDVGSLKNGCKIKRILKEIAHPRINDRYMSLEVNEFIAYDDMQTVGFNGLHKFKDQNIGKAWRI